jgi:ferredoxin
MAAVALLSLRGAIDDGIAMVGTSLCAGCGACTRHCHWHIDVAAHLSALRAVRGEPPQAVEPPAIAVDTVDGRPRFVTCWEGSTAADGQLACCGARGDFVERQPEAAAAMADEIVFRMDKIEHFCGVTRCAEWLRAHGAPVRGPNDAD